MELFFTVLYGLIIGSFLNVCIYRIPKGDSIAFPPSHCFNCGKKIKWYDLFPVVSYIILGGKCRFCKDKISIRYPLIELATGVLFGALYLSYGFSIELLRYAILIPFLIVIGMIDLDTTDVYDVTVFIGIACGIVFIGYTFITNGDFLSFIYGGLLAGGVITLIILLTKGMGWGDAEICLLCGLFLGLRLTIVMMMLSFVIGGIVGIFLIVTKIKSRKDYIPFGPFIAAATIITIFLGNNIINWYFSYIIK